MQAPPKVVEAEPTGFDKYQTRYPKTMAEAEEYQPEPKPDMRGYRQRRDKRVGSKHWTVRRFKATFVQFTEKYDPRQRARMRYAELSDVEMDGLPLTLHWTVVCPRSLAELCTAPGVVIEFTAEFSETAHDAKRAGHALLRPPFRKVAP